MRDDIDVNKYQFLKKEHMEQSNLNNLLYIMTMTILDHHA